MQKQLSQYTSALDILVERSRQSWNEVPPAILPSGHESLRFSFISHVGRFSTTALYINQKSDRQPTTAFDFDYEVTNSRIYQRAMADDARRACLATFRVSLADSFQISEEPDKDNHEGFREKATTYSHPGVMDEARVALKRVAQMGNSENPDSRWEAFKHLRSTTPQWPLLDQQPGATRNLSQSCGPITSGPSDAAAATTNPAAPTSNFSQHSSIFDLGLGPAASLPMRTIKSVDSNPKPLQPPPKIQLPQIRSTRAPSYYPRQYKIAVVGGGGTDKSALVIQVSGAI